jgi:uncharacterized membrane protein
MTIETILLGVILILSGLLGWEKRESRLERAKLINALMAKNAQEMANLDLADKTEIKAEVPTKAKESEFVAPENLSQEDWEKAALNG